MVVIFYEERSKIVKENFVNKLYFFDVIFYVKNIIFYVYRVVLMVRFEVMVVMFGGGFSERDSFEVCLI